MIIGLTGQMRSGKDTVGAYMVEKHGFERKSFADQLKLAVAALLDIAREDVEMWKMVDNVRVVVENEHNPSNHYVDLSFRSFLQRFGTEMGREVFWYDFWVDLLFKNIYKFDDYVITDVRFENEAKKIKEMGGYILRLHRPDTEHEATHASEKLLPYELIDVTVINDSSIEKLYKAVDNALMSLGVLV